MSQRRFSPLTSDLLVRKGDVTPSAMDGRPSVANEIAGARASARLPEAPAPAARTAKLVALQSQGGGSLPPSRGTRKLVVRISYEDYERLGLAAVKRETSRSEIVRQAMDTCLQQLPREFRSSCACISPRKQCPAG